MRPSGARVSRTGGTGGSAASTAGTCATASIGCRKCTPRPAPPAAVAKREIVPPRDGPGQRGTFDWSRAVGHEYVHTVTLDQTDNRVQHWFTEACAVSQEPGGREYETCQLLATALNAAKLFDLKG